MEDETMLEGQEPDAAEETAEVEAEEEEYTEYDDADEGGDPDTELEYDEDGNVILPDDEDEEDGAEADEQQDADEEPAKGADNAAQDAKYRRLEAQARATLEMLGEDVRDGEGVLDALERIAAETKGVSRSEYRKEVDDANELAAAKQLLKNMEYEKKAQADLSVLHNEFPETKQYKHLKEMPADVLRKFARYRDLGLEPKEAYAAANPDGIRTGAAASATQKVKNAGKSHLTSTVPKKASDHSTSLSKNEISRFREQLHNMGNLSDKEILEIYKMTKE